MKILAAIAAAFLGLVFIFFSAMFLLHLAPAPKLAPDSPAAAFMAAMIPTGYFKFVKIFELIGGAIILNPKTRNWGLLILCPIIANILAYDLLIDAQALAYGIVLAALALFLLWTERAKFEALLR